MSKVERLYHLHNILDQRRTPISRHELMERLEKSGLNIRALLECVCARREDVTGKISRIDPEIVKAMTTLNRLLK